MHEQADLYPVARTTDPATSHEAAAKVTESGHRLKQRELAFELVNRYPGRTSLELARLSKGLLDRYDLARRLPELRNAGAVRNGNARKCVVSGYTASTWWPVAR